MHIIGEMGLGILVFAALALEGGVMFFLTGRFLQLKPEGSGVVMLANCWNSAVLLLFMPLVGILLIAGWLPVPELSGKSFPYKAGVYLAELLGLAFFLGGTALVVLGFLVLKKAFQPGGYPPREGDRLLATGIYAHIRHPLYGGVMAMMLGLALCAQSWWLLALFCVYLVLVLLLIPREESDLEKAHPDVYPSYRERTKRFIPKVF